MEEKREKSIFRLLPLCVCQLEKFALKVRFFKKSYVTKYRSLYITLFTRSEPTRKQALSSPVSLSVLGTTGTVTPFFRPRQNCLYFIDSRMEYLLFLRFFSKLLFGAVERLHSTGLQACHFARSQLISSCFCYG